MCPRRGLGRVHGLVCGLARKGRAEVELDDEARGSDGRPQDLAPCTVRRRRRRAVHGARRGGHGSLEGVVNL